MKPKLDKEKTVEALVDSIMAADGLGATLDDMLADALRNGRKGFSAMSARELREVCELWQVQPVEKP